jgi:hypothetical protein
MMSWPALAGISTTVLGGYGQNRAASTAVCTLFKPPTRVKAAATGAGGAVTVSESEYAPIPTTARAAITAARLRPS